MNASPAAHYLQKVIDRARVLEQSCLPSLRSLARDSGTSYSKMWTAVQKLCKEGVLIVRKNRGIFITDKLTGNSTPAIVYNRQSKFKRIAGKLQNEIRNGSLGTNQNLPSCKELCSRFGVNYRTMQKALQVLTEKNLIEPWYLGYRIRSLEKQTGRGTIVLIGRGNADGLLFSSWRNLSHLETECYKAGVQLLTVAFYFTGDLYLRGVGKVTIAEIIKDKTILGFHIWTSAIGPHPSYYRLLETLNTLGKPITILSNNEEREPVIRWKIPVRMYCIGLSPQCGHRVTEYLISAGHTRLAYVSLFHECKWSQTRLAGIEQTLKDLQIRDPLLTLVTKDNPAEYSTPTKNLVKKVKLMVKESFAAYNRSRPNALEASYNMDLDKIENRFTLSKSITHLFLDTIIKKKPTAIIGGNDLISIELKLLLESNGFSIPKDISIIGFDNSYEATLNGLTSYDFNDLTIVHRMIEFVIDSRAKKHTGFEKIEIDGYIVERGSVGIFPHTKQPKVQI